MRTPNKKRFLDAVHHLETEEIPFFESEVDISIVNRILGSDFPFSLHSYELPIPDCVELNMRMGNDMVSFSHMWRLGRREKVDENGRIHYIDGTFKAPESLRDIWYPDLDHLEKRLDELCRLIDGTGFGIVCSVKSAPFVVATAMGYQDYWMATLDNPGFIHEFTKIIQEWCLRAEERFLQYPIDVIKVGSVFVNKSGQMCSPAMLEEFETFYLRQQIDLARSKGLPVCLHIDGNVMTMIEGLIAMGVDILHPIEPCDGKQDIYEIKRRYGDRLALHGNIDINGVLLNGSPEEIQQDVTEHIERLAPGGGYILASSHDIHQEIPIENFYAMRDATHEFRFERTGVR
jgi:hypothetical protein